METKSLELNQQEAQGLLSLLDVATKAGGLNVAHNALYFASKVSKLFEVKAELPKKEEIK